MSIKLFYVTQATRVSKKRVSSRVVGFVSTFGWEKPEDKAAKKYPQLENFDVHEVPKKFSGR